MAIRVNTHGPLGSDRFNAATGWHVDDNGYLHVIEVGKGNLATFHPGAWQSVERIEDAIDPSKVAAELAYNLRTK